LKGVEALFEEMVNDVVHKNVLEKGSRPDGANLMRSARSTPKWDCSPARTLGLFVRGNTQALAVTTLAAPGPNR